MSATPKPTTDDLEELIDKRVEEAVEEKTADLREELEEEREQRREVERKVERLEEKVHGLQRETNILDSRCDALADAVDDLEERLEDGDLADEADAGADPDVSRETPLEDVVALPEDVADRELSKNVQRARWFASKARSAGSKTPAGYQLTAGEIGRLLDVALEVEPHPETVARVISIIDEMGHEETVRRKRNGEKRIVLKEDLVRRLEAHSDMSRKT
jgi:predicted RNase H-like nuclease (RuvC/YqgF family)